MTFVIIHRHPIHTTHTHKEGAKNDGERLLFRTLTVCVRVQFAMAACICNDAVCAHKAETQTP